MIGSEKNHITFHAHFLWERVIVVLRQLGTNSAMSWREQVNCQCDDEIRFVRDQHVELDFYSASSLKQQYAPLGHIILIPSQPVFALTP